MLFNLNFVEKSCFACALPEYDACRSTSFQCVNKLSLLVDKNTAVSQTKKKMFSTL